MDKKELEDSIPSFPRRLRGRGAQFKETKKLEDKEENISSSAKLLTLSMQLEFRKPRDQGGYKRHREVIEEYSSGYVHKQ